MDDRRIRELTEEVLKQLAGPKEPVAADLEARVATLEARVAALAAGGPHGAATPPAAPAPIVVQARPHVAFQILEVSGGSERCVLEPDKPCVQSGQCRMLGH